MSPSARTCGVGIAVLAGLGVAAASFAARRAAALYDTPELAAVPGLSSVTIRSGAGGEELPGWIAPGPAGGDRWAVFLSGLGSHPLRHQGAMPAFRERGYTCLFASHSARRPARRHAFGAREVGEALGWIRFAADRGAREVVLLGWSFGASLWLRALTEPLPVVVRAVVLTGPLVDWSETIVHGARGGVVARVLATAVRFVLAVPFLCRIAGQPVRVSLRPAPRPPVVPPLVVVHSDADATVPLVTSERLVAVWPAPARLHIVRGARHGAERDVDPTGWLDVVTSAV